MARDMAYIARERRCGCVTAATVDRPDSAKFVAREIARWVKEGRRVERMSVDRARPLIGPCKHRRQKAAPAPAAAGEAE